MKNNVFIKGIISIICSILIGTVLMMGIYAIPNERLISNVERSSSLYINGENKINNWVGNLRYGKLDNSTDAAMIDIAMCREYDSLVNNALLNPLWDLKQEAIANDNSSNISLFFDENNIEGINSYSRYWHGYLLYLVPGLTLFTVGEMRMLMMAIQFIIAMVLLFGVGTRLGVKYMLPYMAAIIFINPITTALNFQNADVYIITILACIVILYFNNFINRNKNYYLLFTLTGICIAFFDFLTYPIVSFGLPMITYLLMNRKNLKESLYDIVLCFVFWGAGYVGMWAGKWIIASILTSENIIADAISALTLRSGIENSEKLDLSYINALNTTKESFWDPVNAALCILFALVTVLINVMQKNKLDIKLGKVLPLLVVSLSFFLWVFVARNHYITHQFLEYRSFAIVVLAFYVLISDLFGGGINEKAD